MISTFAYEYCSEDVSKIKNFKAAARDGKKKWVCFHRNHLSGIGFVSRHELKAAGLWKNRPARELIFLKRDEANAIEKNTPPNTHDAHWVSEVAKFWT